MNEAECVLLVIFAALIFGTYGLLRKHLIPNLHFVSILTLYTFGQLFLSMIVWAASDFPIDIAANMNKKWYALIGGIVIAFVEFLYLGLVLWVDSSTAFAIMSGVGLIFGSFADYFITIDSDDLNVKFLVVGILLEVVGIVSLTMAQFSRPKASTPTLTNHDDNPEHTPILLQSDNNSNSTAVGTFDHHPESITRTQSEREKTSKTLFYLGLLVFSGVLNSSWSVLPATAVTGPGAIVHSSFVLLLLCIGQVIGLPFALYFFAYLDLLSMMKTSKLDANVVKILEDCFLHDLWMSEGWWSLICGVLVAAGYGAYFYGTSSPSLPISVGYAICNSANLVCVLCAVFVFREYDQVPFLSRTFAWILFAFGCYVAAIFVLAFLSYN